MAQNDLNNATADYIKQQAATDVWRGNPPPNLSNAPTVVRDTYNSAAAAAKEAQGK